jgi:G protein-coupled receptor Mth (Methuselah protein)
MGLSWIIEICSHAIGNSDVMHVAALVNCLQGFLIFALFVVKQKVIELITAR